MAKTLMTPFSEWQPAITQYLWEMAREKTYKRGKDYACAGHVSFLCAQDGCLLAEVLGSSGYPYDVSIHLVKDKQDAYLEGECTCPVGYECKHVLATLIQLLGEVLKREATLAPQLRAHVPDAWRFRPERVPFAKVEGFEEFLNLPARKGTGGGRADSIAQAQALATPPQADLSRAQKDRVADGPWWLDYLNAPSRAARAALLEAVVECYVGRRQAWWYRGLPVEQIASMENPVAALRHFQPQLLEYFYYYGGGSNHQMDDRLAEFLESEEAHAVFLEHERRRHANTLINWLTEPATPSDNAASLEVVWFANGGLAGLPTLAFAALLSTKRLNRSARTASALEQLRREVTSGKRALSEDQNALLEWLLTMQHQSVGVNEHAEMAYQVFDIASWCQALAHRGVVKWVDGGTLSFSHERAHLSLCPVEGGELEWSVVLPAQGDTVPAPIPLREAVVYADPAVRSMDKYKTPISVYFRQGDCLRPLETGNMQHDVLYAVTLVPRVPAEALRDAGRGSVLYRRLLAHAPAHAVAELVHEVPVRPRVELWLEGNSLTVSASADSVTEDGPPARFVFTPMQGWRHGAAEGREAEQNLDTELVLEQVPEEEKDAAASESVESAPGELPAPQVPKHAIVLHPRRADVEAVEAWLRQMLPGWSSPTLGPSGFSAMKYRLVGEEVPAMFEHWARRPAHVAYFGNKSFVTFIQVRRAPQLKVKVEPSGIDMLSVSVAFEKEFEEISLAEVEQSLRNSDQQMLQLPSGGTYRRKDLENLQKQAEALGNLGVEIGASEQQLHAMHLAGEATQELMQVAQDETAFQVFQEKAQELVAKFKGIPKVRLLKKTSAPLRPYQRAGVDFLVWACETFGGGLLADDMGLGKTLQVLVTLQALRKRSKLKLPALVVCPASVAHNWQREAQRFLPEMRVVVIERGAERRKIQESLHNYDLVVKNYALTRRDAEVLQGQEWLAVCVDEAQAIKNPGAAISHTVKQLNARYRIALTGTPIENRLTDLWSIMDFAVPGYLPPQQSFEARMRRLDDGLAFKMLRARLRPVLLRRVKQEVAPELPPRIEERRDCAMESAQRKLYLRELKTARLLLEEAGDQKVAGKQRIMILAALTRLRQICCDPGVLGHEAGSGKTEVLLETLLPLLENGEKVLVFSQFVRVLQRLEARLNKENVRTHLLTGSTNNRQQLVERFEADTKPGVFLISLKAGGTGLNLTSAAHVILFDPWWNPAVEAQAIDRTHRIGQDRTVLAFRLVAENTIEERILELQARKRDLVKNVFEADGFNRMLTREDFDFILS